MFRALEDRAIKTMGKRVAATGGSVFVSAGVVWADVDPAGQIGKPCASCATRRFSESKATDGGVMRSRIIGLLPIRGRSRSPLRTLTWPADSSRSVSGEPGDGGGCGEGGPSSGQRPL